MASFRYCGETAPHDQHEWGSHHEVVEPVSGGREVLSSSYHHCPGVEADSEIVKLLDKIELKELELEAAKEEARVYALSLRRTECDFYNLGYRECDYRSNHGDEFCFGCPRAKEEK